MRKFYLFILLKLILLATVISITYVSCGNDVSPEQTDTIESSLEGNGDEINSEFKVLKLLEGINISTSEENQHLDDN